MSISRLCVAATAILFVSGCGSGGDGGTTPTPTPASVTVSVTGSTTLSIGDTRPVTAVVRDGNNAVMNNASVSWTSSNTAAVTVSPATGLSTTATAAGNGSSNIRAQSGTVSGQTTLTVAPTPTSVTVSVTGSTTLPSIGDTRPVTAVVRDANNAVISNATVTWTSSNTAAVTVSPATGLTTTATATGNGSSNIIAQSGTVSGQTTLTVAQAFASLVVTPPTATINKTAPGNTVQLTATPKDARGNNIAGLPAATFTSGNTAAATVSSNSGLVTAVDVGTAVITASLTSGAVTQTGTSTITVQSAPASQTVTVNVGQSGDNFTPTPVTINRNDTIRYNFVAGLHNVTFAGTSGAPSNIPDTTPPAFVDRVFSTGGTFNYQCTNHSGMNGTVVVNP